MKSASGLKETLAVLLATVVPALVQPAFSQVNENQRPEVFYDGSNEITREQAKEQGLEEFLLRDGETPNWITKNKKDIRIIKGSSSETLRQIYLRDLSEIIFVQNKKDQKREYDLDIRVKNFKHFDDGGAYSLHYGTRPFDQNYLAVLERIPSDKEENYYFVLFGGDVVNRTSEEERLEIENKLKDYAKRNKMRIGWIDERFKDVSAQIEARKEREGLLKHLGLDEKTKAEIQRMDFDGDKRQDYIVICPGSYLDGTSYYFVRNTENGLETVPSSLTTLKRLKITCNKVMQQSPGEFLIIGERPREPRTGFYFYYKDGKMATKTMPEFYPYTEN